MSSPRSIIATAALPYANGDIHLGHLLEYLQVDFWVRFQRMRGNECVYLCSDDSHGTAIMLKAQELKMDEKAFILLMKQQHLQDFTDFEIAFDEYDTTDSVENKILCYEIYESYRKNTLEQAQKQLFCPQHKMFLPDRFVTGSCPKCSASAQYGDSCSACGAVFDPQELKEPKCSLCQTPPEVKETSHIFLNLENYRKELTEHVSSLSQAPLVNKLQEWLKEPLRNWAISRDAPYFGFEIPDAKNKFFYVWADAPVGYLAAAKKLADKEGKDLKSFWNNSEVYHFIGKDIIYFHCLFWVAMLSQSNYKKPDQVFAHGFLNVNGEKMSKSKGTFITARNYLNHLPPVYLRYYLASKLSPSIDDLGFYDSEFLLKINSELVGKITNLISRSATMLEKNFSNKLCLNLDAKQSQLLESLVEQGESLAKYYENRNFMKALQQICKMSEQANVYFSDKEPWKLVKSDPPKAHQVLSTTINAFRKIAIYLSPILPSYSQQVAHLFGEADGDGEGDGDGNGKTSPYTWDDAEETLLNRSIQSYSHLVKKLSEKDVAKLFTA